MHSIFSVCSDFMMAFACVVTIATTPISCWLFWNPLMTGLPLLLAQAWMSLVALFFVRWTIFQKRSFHLGVFTEWKSIQLRLRNEIIHFFICCYVYVKVYPNCYTFKRFILLRRLCTSRKIFNVFICVDYHKKVEFAVDGKTLGAVRNSSTASSWCSILLYVYLNSCLFVPLESINCNQTFSTNQIGISCNYSAHSIKIAFVCIQRLTFEAENSFTMTRMWFMSNYLECCFTLHKRHSTNCQNNNDDT